jgi:hypothetical protein
MKISASDLRDLKILKYYRITRKWACKQNGLSDSELELIIYLDSLGLFTIKDYQDGAYIYKWDKKRWQRLKAQGWIEVWRNGNRKIGAHNIYKTTFKTKILVTRIYKILLGEEDIPYKSSNVFYKNKSYTDKVMNKAIDDMHKDKER